MAQDLSAYHYPITVKRPNAANSKALLTRAERSGSAMISLLKFKYPIGATKSQRPASSPCFIRDLVFSDSATASLLLYLDHGSAEVTGALTRNTLTAAPNPNVVEKLTNQNGGSVSGGTTKGTVNTTSTRQYALAGYVDTSHGRVDTQVNQYIHFGNFQRFNVVGLLGANPGAVDDQDISQTTIITSRSTVRNDGNTWANVKQLEWPLTANISLITNSDGSFTQTAKVEQGYNRSDIRIPNGAPTFSSVLSNQVASQDTLFLSSSFSITGNQGQTSSQKYFYGDTAGVCYSKTLSATDNVLSAVTNGEGCKH